MKISKFVNFIKQIFIKMSNLSTFTFYGFLWTNQFLLKPLCHWLPIWRSAAQKCQCKRKRFFLSIRSSWFEGFNPMSPPAGVVDYFTNPYSVSENLAWTNIALCNRFRFWSNQTWPWIAIPSLHWRHNERDGVSNHQPRDCLLNRICRRRWKKH